MTIELYKATLHFDDGKELDDMSLLVGSGERVALTGGGANGGSLVLQAILGLQRLERGWVCVDGEPVQPSFADYYRHRMAYMPRDLDFGGMTIENVARELSCGNSGKRRRQPGDVAAQLVSFGVDGDIMGKPFRNMAKSVAQRAMMALTFMASRPIALMDDPTAWQDDQGRELVAQYMMSGRFADVALVVATHDPVIVNVCDRVVDLDKFIVGSPCAEV